MNHSFDIDEAQKHGVECAIILNNVRHWIAYNKANGINIIDGRVWTFNSVRAYSELFPYWSTDQIRRYIEKLEKSGALIVGSYNKRGGDRTKWHSIPGEAGEAPADHVAKSPYHLADSPEQLAKSPNGNGELATALPYINTYIKPDVKHTHTARDLSPLLTEYSEKVRRIDQIATDYAIQSAIAENGADIVEQAIRAIIQAAQDPQFPRDKLPGNLSALLRNTERVQWWASKYKLHTIPTETGPPSDPIAETLAWLEAMTDDERRETFAWAAKSGLKYPDEVTRRWPEALNLELTKTA